MTASSDTASGPGSRGPLQPARHGSGPLLQRDYWAVIANCRYTPSQVIELLRRRFAELPPPDMVEFSAPGPLELRMSVDIAIGFGGGPCCVRVIHRDACSFTFATLTGHPEAGRITFGAYRNDRGDVIFHIRSRARSRSRLMYFGFRSAGDPMQTTTWTDLVNNVAITCGDGVYGYIQAETSHLPLEALEPGDELLDRPTFLARGD